MAVELVVGRVDPVLRDANRCGRLQDAAVVGQVVPFETTCAPTVPQVVRPAVGVDEAAGELLCGVEIPGVTCSAGLGWEVVLQAEYLWHFDQLCLCSWGWVCAWIRVGVGARVHNLDAVAAAQRIPRHTSVTVPIELVVSQAQLIDTGACGHRRIVRQVVSIFALNAYRSRS